MVNYMYFIVLKVAADIIMFRDIILLVKPVIRNDVKGFFFKIKK